jgi:hypothetical protein
MDKEHGPVYRERKREGKATIDGAEWNGRYRQPDDFTSTEQK